MVSLIIHNLIVITGNFLTPLKQTFFGTTITGVWIPKYRILREGLSGHGLPHLYRFNKFLNYTFLYNKIPSILEQHLIVKGFDFLYGTFNNKENLNIRPD